MRAQVACDHLWYVEWHGWNICSYSILRCLWCQAITERDDKGRTISGAEAI